MAPYLYGDGHYENLEQDHGTFNTANDGANEEESPTAPMEAIAVIGLAFKFPQEATSLEAFWRMIVTKRCAMTDFPPSRLNVDAFYDPDVSSRDTLPLRGGHFIAEDLGAFDAGFFSITPTEAAAMDPAQRLLLETAYQGFENAGIPIERSSGSNTSVHTGCFTDDYKLQTLSDTDQIPKYAATGLSLAMLANRLSWFFNLNGPSVNMDSACSSSGMALDHACSLLRSKDCDMSLVAGCNLTYVSDYTSILTKMSFLSPDSRCYTFDHRANGYARGEGIGVVLLKRLSDAIRDGNTIRAIVRSSGSNQDARTPGITQPSSKAQERLIRETYRKAGLSMKHTRFVEAHGTGTQLGDKTEANALGDAFRDHRTLGDPLYVGAVKTNIGHLEGASGIAGLIKAVLVLETGIIVPNTNFERINNKIDANYLNLALPSTCVPWPSDGLRRISVNSFGFGGSNAHVILDDAFNYLRTHKITGIHCTAQRPPKYIDPGKEVIGLWNQHYMSSHFTSQERQVDVFKTPKLLLLSASDREGVLRTARRYQEHLSEVLREGIDHQRYVRNLLYTLDSRRSSLQWRSHVILSSFSDLEDLSTLISTPVSLSVSPPRLGYAFTGQGAQWYAMGRELLDYPVFAESIDDADSFLKRLSCVWSVKDELTKDQSESHLDDPIYSQPVCTIVQVALVDLLASTGVCPVTVIGHSSGEIAAAYCARAISKQSAWKIAYYRGYVAGLLTTTSGVRGAMMSIGLSAEEMTPFLSAIDSESVPFNTNICCFNSPRNVTVSGPETQIDVLKTILDKKGVFARKLKVAVAYHSQQMAQVASKYLVLLGEISTDGRQGSVPMISSVTGARVEPQELLSSEYWIQNMVLPVRFKEAMELLCSNTRRVLTKKIDGSHRNAIFVDHVVEIGPHAALQTPILECSGQVRAVGEITYGTVLRRNVSASRTFLDLVGQLHALGYPVDIRRVNDPFKESTETQMALVDLPAYPFDHSMTYWHESRLSSDHRLREHGHVELLGNPAQDWNPLDAQWRNVINSGDITWASEHSINGAWLCPGAGMLVMAIEAALQVADPSRRVTSFRLRTVAFQVALDLSNDLETRFSLRASKNHRLASEPWYDFAVFSLREGKWTEHCTGGIQIQYRLPDSPTAQESSHSWTHYQDAWKSLQDVCSLPGDPHHMYEFLQKRGIEYGQQFRKIVNFRYSGAGHTVADVDCVQGAEGDPHKPHLLHPTTLDAIMHSVFFAQSRGGSQDINTQVPTAIESMWISNDNLEASTNRPLSVTTRIEADTPHGVICSSVIANKRQDVVFVVISGLEMSTVAGSTFTTLDESPGDSQVWSTMTFIVDPDALTPEQTIRWLDESLKTNLSEPVAFYEDVQNLLEAVMLREYEQSDSSLQDDRPAHLKRYIEWIRWQLDERSLLRKSGPIPRLIEELDSSVREYGAVGLAFSEVSRSLNSILKGQIDPLQLLFNDGLVEGYYKQLSESSSIFTRLQKYVQAVGFKRPNLNIIEVGAGTGVLTNLILQALSIRNTEGIQARMFDHYHFTDISPSFFEDARIMFSEYGQKLSFGLLDIENNNDQEDQQGLYDMVIAANVLHISKDLSAPLRNLRRTLKPGGKLIIHETTTPHDLKTGFIFGLLQDWWLATEPNRTMSPLVTEVEWDSLLKETGFSGTDMVLRDFENPLCHQSSIMISTAQDSEPSSDRVISAKIVVNPDSPLQQATAQNLQTKLRIDYNCSVTLLSADEISSQECSKDTLYISLLELEDPFIQEVNAKAFSDFQSFMSSVHQILWTTGGGGVGKAAPGFGMVEGFARALRLERNDLKLVTLALDTAIKDVGNKVDQILQVISQAFTNGLDTASESEYVQLSGMLHVKRIAPAIDLKSDFVWRLAGTRTETQSLKDSPPFEVKTAEGVNPAKVQFVSCPEIDLRPDEVEIQVRAIGINSPGMPHNSGAAGNAGLGIECAGTITRTGENIAAMLEIGDRVCMLGSGFCRSFAVSKSSLVARTPDSLTFEQAATLPYHSWLASYLIDKVARLNKDDSLLIQGDSDTLSRLIIELAKETGATVFATCHSDQGQSALNELVGASENRILPAKGFADRLQHTEPKQKLDVILNICGNEDLAEAARCLSPGGRLIHLKRPSSLLSDDFSLSHLPSNAMFTSIDPMSLLEKNIVSLHKPLQNVIDQVVSKPRAFSDILSFDLSCTAEAVQHLKDMDQPSRVVISMDPQDSIPLTKSLQPEYYFDSNASYVIAGGLGGLGRCIAQWMSSRGARNLILLSRSGPRTSAAHEMIKNMTANNIRVETPACDVANTTALEETISECMKTMPPIKGCIQASGAIQDTWFGKMTYDDWTATTRPKVQGSWNLHTVLPTRLDFFILTASISGIFGQITQANYAAGNTYQDALARHRIAHGEKAASLDLGLLTIDGLLADKPEVVERLNSTGYFIPLTEPEIIAIFDKYCNPNLELSDPAEAQPIIGIQSPAALRVKGIELPTSMQQPLWSHMVCTGNEETTSTQTKDQTVNLAALVAGAESAAVAGDIATEALINRVAQILTIPVEKLDAHRPTHVYGVDSLTAIEVRNWISKTFAIEVAVFEILGDNSFADLGRAVARKCGEARRE